VTPGDLGGFALTALARHRLRTALSLLGVAIGVTAVVLLTALGEGARRYVTGQFAQLGANLLILVPGKNETTGTYPGVAGVANDLTLDDALALRRGLPNLQVLAPISMGNETVAHRERRRQVMVIGATHQYRQARELRIVRGRFLPPGKLDRGGQTVVLGATVAEELFPEGQAIGRVVRIGDWRMRVIGVIESVGTQIGLDMDDLVIVPVATGMRMFNRSSLFRILLKTHSSEDVQGTCAQAKAILTERHDEDDVTCIAQESVVSSLSSILTVLTLALGGIAAISLSVAGIGIMNVMLVSVSERTEEVGLLKAVGARSRQILAVFLAEAVLLAGIGGVVGLLLGWASVQMLVGLYPVFPAATPLWASAAAFSTSLVVGALFGVLPARRAMRLDPVAALAGR
jgi:putative ABC transport system permease protein